MNKRQKLSLARLILLRETMLNGSKEQQQHYQSKMFTGYDFDGTMLRIGTLNMLLHGISNPTIENRNALSVQNTDCAAFSVILANPPFTGSVTTDEIGKDLTKLNKTTKSELLFLRLFLRMLTVGGRAGDSRGCPFCLFQSSPHDP